MKQIFLPYRWLAVAVALLFGAAMGHAQNTVVPVPFVTAIAGAAAGSTNTAPCADSIPNSAGQNIGDNCVPTQAIFPTMNDSQVDSIGNIYISDSSTVLTPSLTVSGGIRVIYYGGTALTAALIAANQAIPNFTPIPGRVYTLVGSLTGNISAQNGVYHCSNVSTNAAALDTLGDGCPGAQVVLAPRGLHVDQYGNVIFTNLTYKYGLRVLYSGGTQMAKLITLLNPTVVTPQVGFVYQLGFNGATGAEGDGGLATLAGAISPRSVTTDATGNIYMTDGTTVSSSVNASVNNVRMIDVNTGLISTVAGETTCGQSAYKSASGCPYGYSGDGGPATSALFNSPYVVFFDQNNNMFIGDNTNARLRVVYRGGTLAGITNPVVGNIYTYAGGDQVSGVQGTLQVDNTPAQQIKFSAVGTAGIDPAGNIYILDPSTHYLWKIDAVTGIGNIIAGGVNSTAGPTAGKYCNGGTAGPVSVDNFGDGCPAVEAYITATYDIPFDTMGNFYFAANGTYALGNLIVQKFSYNQQFPSTAVGTPVNQYVAFTGTVSVALSSRSFTLQGGATTEYTDAGGTACATAMTLVARTLCVVNVSFNPAHAGRRPATLTLFHPTGPIGSLALQGTGIASDVAVDNGTVSSIGTGITPSGIAADVLGNVFVADSKAGQLLKGSATGTTLTSLASGLKNPSQVSLDNAGNIYIADTGNNRIQVVSSTGAAVATLGTGLNAPRGVAVDTFGDIFVADTGNNRIVQLALNGNQLSFPLTGIDIPLSSPGQLGMDPSGNLYILDAGNSRIVEYNISTALTSTFTVDPGVIPAAFAIDPAGDIYVADTTSKSVLNYYAGATPGFPLMVGLGAPAGLASDPDGNLFVADTTLTAATELRRSLANIAFPMTTPAMTTTAAITVDNVGNAPLTFQTPLATIAGASAALFSLSPSTSNGCGAGVSYAAGTSCNFTASYTPVAVGNQTATASFVTNAANRSTAVALLSGSSVALAVPTTLTLSVAPAGGVFYSSAVVLTARLTASPLTSAFTGNFTLTVDGKTEQPPVAVGSGTVVFTLNLPIGTHQLSVTYSGGAPYQSSAASVTVPVKPAATTTTLVISPVTNNGTASLTFTASVAATTAVGQTGIVTIYAGTMPTGTVVCQQPLSPTYTISCSTMALSFGNNTYTAVYSGSSNGNFSGSSSVPQVLGAGDFVVGPLATSFTIPQGYVGQLNVNLTALYSGTGTVIPGCSGLPANSVCRFSPNNVALGATPTQVLVQVYTNVDSNLALNRTRDLGSKIVFAIGLPFGLGLLTLRRKAGLRMLALSVLCVALTAGISGCGGTRSLQTFSTVTTPAGTYPITLTFTGSNGFTETHSIGASFIVVPATSGN